MMRNDRIEFTDRYKATGTPYPKSETMCQGQCDGMGVYPHRLGSEGETPDERKAWESSHNAENGHDDGECDGYHFIRCTDCDGTGKIQ